MIALVSASSVDDPHGSVVADGVLLGEFGLLVGVDQVDPDALGPGGKAVEDGFDRGAVATLEEGLQDDLARHAVEHAPGLGREAERPGFARVEALVVARPEPVDAGQQRQKEKRGERHVGAILRRT
jgi:hypothetical protein